MKGKRVIVTGGGRGIGWAIAQQFLAANARVAIFDLQIPAEAAEQTLALEVDVSDSAAVNAATQRVADELGGVEILVNSAGINRDKISWKLTDEQWDQVIDVDLKGCFTTARAAIPLMRKASWGRIVNISSTASMENNGPVTFCAAKAALTAYTRSMGRILATETGNVVMSAVLPGAVVTEGGHWDAALKERPGHAEKYLVERCPLGRFGEIWEISPVVVLLCSNQASFCHGAVVGVDAGQSRHYFNVSGL